MDIRAGIGYDVHQLKEGAPLMIGGIRVEHYKGATGHSDADVLIHSICDALLGAANLRDIGFQFPNTDDKYKNIDSKILLKQTGGLLTNAGWQIINVDNTICLQQPRLSHLIPQMQQTLSKVLHLEDGRITIKSTTTESLGFVGRQEGISAMSVALIQRQ